MKTITRALILLTATAAGTALFGQENSPPPIVTSAPPPAAAPAPEPIPVDGLIHVQQLPTTAQLARDADAEGMSITRMDQLADRIVVTYRYASGNQRTFAYTTTLPSDPDSEVAVAPSTPAPAPAPNYTVVYTEPAPVYYSPRYVRTYDPYYYGPSVSIGLGFGRGFSTYGHSGYYGRSRYYGPSYNHGHRSHGRGDGRR